MVHITQINTEQKYNKDLFPVEKDILNSEYEVPPEIVCMVELIAQYMTCIGRENRGQN